MKNKKKNPIAEVFSYAQDKKTIMYSVILAIVSVLGGLLPYFSVSYLVIGLINQTLTLGQLLLWGGVGIGGYLLKTICFTLSSICSHKMAYTVMAEIRTTLARKLLRLSMGKATQKSAGEYKEIILDEMEHLEYPLAHMLPELTSHILGFLLVIIYIFTVSWQLALASLGTLLLGFLIYSMMMAGKDVMGMFGKYTKDSEAMAGTMVEYVSGMEVIKAFGRTASSMEKFSSAITTFRDSMKAWFAHCYPFLAGFYVVTPNSLLLVLPIGILLLSAGIVSLNAFILCMFMAFGVAQPLIKIMEFTDHIMAITTTMGKVDELMGIAELPQGTMTLPGADTLKMSHISFGYGDTEILHDVSFAIHKGQKVAFVGASGSGKSTIAKLLVRFYDPNSGSIQIDGVNIQNVPLDNLMSKISFVTQDNFLFDMSIKENIRLGNMAATDTQVVEAAKQVGCHDFICSLVNGYDTPAGSSGNKLSGGQKQRIAIARAILKDAPIVILDEASAFMDPENEDRVQRSIEALTAEKTLIMIAHRIHTIIGCDCIFVVDKGSVIASGTHQQLLESCSTYQTLWARNQNEGVNA